MQAKVRIVDADYTKAHVEYNERFLTEKYESNIGEDYQEIEDDEAPEKFDKRQRIKSIIKHNKALKTRILMDVYISENPKETPERGEESKNRLEKNKATYEKNDEEEKEPLERLGIKNLVLEKEVEALQKQNADLDRLVEEDRKIIADLYSPSYQRESAEARTEQREKEKEWVSERLNATERDLGLEDARPLREKIKEIFKKYGLTVTAIFLAAGASIGAVVGTMTNALKQLGKNWVMALNCLGQKPLLWCLVCESQLPFQSYW